MSDVAPVTESAPQSTQDIAASVIHEAEAQDASSVETGGESRIDTTNTSEAPETTEARPPTPAELSEAAKFLQAQGHQFKKVDGRPTWLPLTTVEKMLDRYVQTHKSTWDGERGVIETQAKQAREALEQVRAAIAGDPRGFLSELAGIDQRYKSFLEPQPQQTAPAVPSDRPKPDIDLGNGQWTYSTEGNQALIRWEAQQLLNERLKPFEEREKEAKAAEAQRKLTETLQQRTGKQMQDAQSWELFGPLAPDGSLTPFQSEVLAELRKDREEAEKAGERPTMSLRQAYLEVRSRHQEPQKVREQVLAELKTAPTAPALGRQTADTQRRPGPRSTADIVRETIRKAEAGG